MKKLTLAAGLVLATLNVATAQSASLPEIMLGHWCAIRGEEGFYDGVANEQDWKECQKGDGYLTMHRTGYSGHEIECRFLAIKKTGRKSVPHTQSSPRELVPIMHVIARCTQKIHNTKQTIQLTYHKGTLMIEPLVIEYK